MQKSIKINLDQQHLVYIYTHIYKSDHNLYEFQVCYSKADMMKLTHNFKMHLSLLASALFILTYTSQPTAQSSSNAK
jgi:hypothetical protein